MTSLLRIEPVGHVQGTIRPPGSKSITNRALVCAALARGESLLNGVLDSEDTQVMQDCLRRMGIELQSDSASSSIRVQGCDGRIPKSHADLFVQNSGTTIRFLTAMAALGNGTFRLDGVERMRQRPIGDLLNTLRQLGVDVHSEFQNDCPPVVVQGRGLEGGTASVRGDVSSQFLSGLLMAAPYSREDVELRIDGPLVSQPYVQMTCRVMQDFGAIVQPDGNRFRVPTEPRYQARMYSVEPDASAASYFWAAAAITGGSVTVQGLTRESLQGDVQFCEALRRMGCEVEYQAEGTRVTGGKLRGVDLDMNAISDTVQTLAAVALFAEGPTRVTGVAHIRHKETDRIGDLARELRKLGARVNEQTDGLQILPEPLHGAEIETYEDHRMAMALSLVGLRVSNVIIRNPGCTKKTYPNFFQDLSTITDEGPSRSLL